MGRFQECRSAWEGGAAVRERTELGRSEFFQRESADVLRAMDLQVRRDSKARSGGDADHSSNGPGELRLGCGAQFVGNGAVLSETGWDAEAAGGVVDSTGRGETNCGASGNGSGQDVSACANEGLQAAGTAGPAEGSRGESVEAVHLEKCFGRAGGHRPRARQRGGSLHRAL